MAEPSQQHRSSRVQRAVQEGNLKIKSPGNGGFTFTKEQRAEFWKMVKTNDTDITQTSAQENKTKYRNLLMSVVENNVLTGVEYEDAQSPKGNCPRTVLVDERDVGEVKSHMTLMGELDWKLAQEKITMDAGKTANTNSVFFPLAAAAFKEKFSSHEIREAFSHIIARTGPSGRENVNECYTKVIEECNTPSTAVSINPITFPGWRMSKKKVSKILAWIYTHSNECFAFTLDHLFLAECPLEALRLLAIIVATEAKELTPPELFSISQEMYSLFCPRRSLNNFSEISNKRQHITAEMPTMGHMYNISNGLSKMVGIPSNCRDWGKKPRKDSGRKTPSGKTPEDGNGTSKSQ